MNSRPDRISGTNLDSINGEFRTVLDSVYTGIIVIDIKGTITFANSFAEKIVRLDLMGKNINAIIPDSKLMEVVQSGQPQFGQRVCIGDKIFLTNRTPIITNGQVTGAVGAFLDITDLEAISHELKSVRELNSELNALIDSSADGLVVSDANGILRRINQAYANMIGIDKEEFTGKPVQDLVRRGYLSDVVTARVLQNGKTATMTQTVRDKEILFTGTPVFEGGKIVRIIANIRDLTELNELHNRLHQYSQEVEQYRSELLQLKNQKLSKQVLNNSPEMQRVIELALRVAEVDTTVLVTGESGVGKEVIARVIFEASKRSNGPFVTINCGALSPTLIESELFGYEEGAFTGASRKGKAGIFEMASGGTLFLDELGELPLDLQVKLLRVIQEHEVTRLGGTKPFAVDIRLIAATNQNLEKMVKEGRFRKDLFFRLNVVNISIPPLRERVTDIPLLVQNFVHRFSHKYNTKKKVSAELMQAFLAYDWPGNVRELENALERMVVLSPGEWLDKSLFNAGAKESCVQPSQTGTLRAALEETERRVILQAYGVYGSTRKAANALGINQSTVVRKLQQYKANGDA